MIIALNALIVKTKLVQNKTQSKVLVIACLCIEQRYTLMYESESGHIAEIL